ncbi:hypothetical protein RSSM_05429 [Rhodopirellula sallentina SM41]|uniref:Uncharacterized protein n=1 Tax=Rhodopirellula sallentina SM41 TaxID=1263870 RepID=M5TVB5_9BACT|nr:hypothetical protein RSSM_05429 [Rhodopirellula sallentina SM41]
MTGEHRKSWRLSLRYSALVHDRDALVCYLESDAGFCVEFWGNVNSFAAVPALRRCGWGTPTRGI